MYEQCPSELQFGHLEFFEQKEIEDDLL